MDRTRLLRPLLLVALCAPSACVVEPPVTPDDDDDVFTDDDDVTDDDDATDDDDDVSDDDDLVDDDDVEPVDHTYACAPVGSSIGDGFFALRAFAGSLYAGQFGYGHEGQSMLASYTPWQLTSPGLLGVSESVCALREFDGRLYANTESSGDIFRSSDGSSWELVHDGDSSSIGCAMEVFDGRLYAVNYRNQAQDHGRILRSADGVDWETVWDSGGAPSYIREIAVHDGALHAFYVDQDSNQGYRLTSSDGVGWSASETPSRIFRARSWDGELWLASADRTSNGVAGIWRDDPGGPVLVFQTPKHYVTELAAWDGVLWAGTSDGWKDDVGTSSLLMTRDGASFETVCDFPEIAAWTVAPSGDHLYVGTWQYGDGGQVYEVTIVEELPGDDDDDAADDDDAVEPVDCDAIADADADWEVCEVTDDTCAGVFTDGAGCGAYCGAAGLVCAARYGGEPGCIFEPGNPLVCGEDNGHQSDWCICERP